MQVIIQYGNFNVGVNTSKGCVSREVIHDGKEYLVVYRHDAPPAVRGSGGKCISQELREEILNSILDINIRVCECYVRVYCETYRRVTVNKLGSRKVLIAEPYVGKVTKAGIVVLGIIALMLVLLSVVDSSGEYIKAFLS